MSSILGSITSTMHIGGGGGGAGQDVVAMDADMLPFGDENVGPSGVIQAPKRYPARCAGPAALGALQALQCTVTCLVTGLNVLYGHEHIRPSGVIEESERYPVRCAEPAALSALQVDALEHHLRCGVARRAALWR